MALTAGDLDFMSSYNSGTYTETNQDGIAVILYSNSPSDNNINNWQFIIESKKGNIRTYTSYGINASSSISNYYIRLERTSGGMTQLSIYADASFTTHLPGSPITFGIDASITGLNTIQHGITTAAYAPRQLNATIDNDLICDDFTADVCSNIILSDNFLSATNWVSVGNGGVNISNGTCNFNNVSGGAYNKVLRDLNTTLSDSYWNAECDFLLTSANPSGHGTGAVLMALTAGNLDFMWDLVAETNQDGIAVVLNSDNPYDENINNWKFIIESKKGNIRTYTSTGISASSSISSYYIRLERTSSNMTQLSIYSDASHTIHLQGSPITFGIDASITGLNTIQHGVATAAYAPRQLSATIDNDLICQEKVEGITSYKNNDQIIIFPNPSGNYINIKFDELSNETLKKYYIYNLQGAEVRSDMLNQFDRINISNLLNGTYIIKFISDNEVYWGKFQKVD
jgi:hypothetical protein